MHSEAMFNFSLCLENVGKDFVFFWFAVIFKKPYFIRGIYFFLVFEFEKVSGI